MSVLRYSDGTEYLLLAYVVMDDHVHAIVQPQPGVVLERIVQAWKSVSAHRINKTLGWTGTLWQPEYFDRIIRNEEELLEKLQYILDNPTKRWPDCAAYRWMYVASLNSAFGTTSMISTTGEGARATVGPWVSSSETNLKHEPG
jgi:hypothetical protein